MAIFKQGQLCQIVVPMVDKTNFASIESGVTSGFTCTLYTYKQNSSTATSAVTLSRAPSVVRSGIIRVTVKSTETSGVDNALLKIAHASCADQYIHFDFQKQDLSGAISDVHSMLSDTLSTMNSQFAVTSNYLSNASNFLSDILSTMGSQFAVVSNYLSNASNYLSNISAVLSDVRSNVSDLQSDFRSRVPKEVATASRLLLLESVASDAHSAAAQANSRALKIVSDVSDILSNLNAGVLVGASSLSDIRSAITAGCGDASLCASDLSDLRSAITAAGGGAGATASQVWTYETRTLTSLADVSLCASDMSDLRSAVLSLSDAISNAYSAAVVGASRALLNQSRISDVYSMLSDFYSDFGSRVPKAVATNSQLSDLASDLKSYMAGMSNVISNLHGDVENLSAVLSDFYSDFQSRVPKAVATNSQLSDLASDLKSAIGNVSVTLTASDISDIASATAASIEPAALGESDISAIAAAVWTHATASNIDSQVGKLASRVPKMAAPSSDLLVKYNALSDMSSDIYARQASQFAVTSNYLSNASNYLSDILSTLGSQFAVASDFYSNIESRVTKEAANASQLLLVKSMASDAHSAAAQANSRTLVLQSMISDVDSALTSQFTAGHPLNASDMSDIRSAILSLSGMLSDAHSAAAQANSRALVIQSMVSDVDSALTSQFALLSDMISNVDSALTSQYTAGQGLTASAISDIDSMIYARLNTAYTDATSLNAGGVFDRIRRMNWILQNKTHVASDTGAVKIYKDDGTTVGLSGTVGADGDSTVRTRMA